MTAIETPPLRLDVAAGPDATEPPEARGLARDEVRLMVAGGAVLRSVLFRDLASFLLPGDVVVVNTSATLPAAVDARRANGSAVRMHLFRASHGGWVGELRTSAGERVGDGLAGEELDLAGGVAVRLNAAYPDPAQTFGSRLWRVQIPVEDVANYLAEVGRPVTYQYIRGQWPITAYQTVFAREPGSAEMPSAGRPFSTALVTELVARGITVAPILLHTALSSLDADELPLAEAFRVPEATARIVNSSRQEGGRVIAVGTTVTRALETVASKDGTVRAGEGWTDLVLTAERPARVVDGLITGWHEAGASHLMLLEAVAGAPRVAEAYAAAVAEGYRWHEFGDSCLFLPSD